MKPRKLARGSVGALHEAMRQAHKEGASLALIARAAGVSRTRVHQIISGD